jgi:hypothetical protein
MLRAVCRALWYKAGNPLCAERMVDTCVALQQVRRINKIGHARHPVMRPFGPAALVIAPRRIDREQKFNRIMQPFLCFVLFIQHGNSGWDKDRRHRPHSVAVKGKQMDVGVFDDVISGFTGAGQ